MKYTILNYHCNLKIESPHFFILNKGLNSGRPQVNETANCWIVFCDDECDLITLYGLCTALFQMGACRFYLVGSVIPFLRLSDMKFLVRRGLELTEPQILEDFQLNMAKIKEIEALLLSQVRLINHAKKVLGSKVIKDYNQLFI